MSAFTPGSAGVVAVLLAGLGATLLIGLLIARLRLRALGRILAWGLVAASVALAVCVTAHEPAGVRMVAMAGFLLYGMKAVVGVESTARLTPLQWLAFAALWPGMRPALFASLRSPARPGAGRLAASGLAHVALGLGLVALGRGAWMASGSLPVAAALLLPGLSLVIHFGLFDLLAAAWRLAGVDARPLFRAPLASRSLREFWGRRWNLAFSEMTALAIYRPLAGIVGPRTGIAASFLVSGLLHELAISVPVHAGYGLPLLYFTLHGGAVFLERASEAGGVRGSQARESGAPWRGRAWTLGWLLAPLPLLFHPPFLRGAVLPLGGCMP